MSQILEINKLFCVYCKKETNNKVGFHVLCKEEFITYQGQVLWSTKWFSPKKLPSFVWCGFDIFPMLLTMWKQEYSKKFRVTLSRHPDSFLQFLAKQSLPKLTQTFEPAIIKKLDFFYPLFVELCQFSKHFSQFSFLDWYISFLLRAKPDYFYEIGRYSKIIKAFKKKYPKEFKYVYQMEDYLYVTLDYIIVSKKNYLYYVLALNEQFTKYYFIETHYKRYRY